tara:strand:- start:563 stop:676 length:114 start_codon:yes stop_codon:yes gene_type:complete
VLQVVLLLFLSNLVAVERVAIGLHMERLAEELAQKAN